MTDPTTIWVAVTGAVTSGLGGTLGGYPLAGRNEEARDIRTAQREEKSRAADYAKHLWDQLRLHSGAEVRRALLENLHEMSEDGDVVIHWDALRQRS